MTVLMLIVLAIMLGLVFGVMSNSVISGLERKEHRARDTAMYGSKYGDRY